MTTPTMRMTTTALKTTIKTTKTLRSQPTTTTPKAPPAPTALCTTMAAAAAAADPTLTARAGVLEAPVVALAVVATTSMEERV